MEIYSISTAYLQISDSPMSSDLMIMAGCVVFVLMLCLCYSIQKDSEKKFDQIFHAIQQLQPLKKSNISEAESQLINNKLDRIIKLLDHDIGREDFSNPEHIPERNKPGDDLSRSKFVTEKARVWVDNFCDRYNRALHEKHISDFETMYKCKRFGVQNMDERVRRVGFYPKFDFTEDGNFYAVLYGERYYVAPRLNTPRVDRYLRDTGGYREIFGVEKVGSLNRLICPAILDTDLSVIKIGELDIQ